MQRRELRAATESSDAGDARTQFVVIANSIVERWRTFGDPPRIASPEVRRLSNSACYATATCSRDIDPRIFKRTRSAVDQPDADDGCGLMPLGLVVTDSEFGCSDETEEFRIQRRIPRSPSMIRSTTMTLGVANAG